MPGGNQKGTGKSQSELKQADGKEQDQANKAGKLSKENKETKILRRLNGRVVMQRPAKPSTSVRLRVQPPFLSVPSA